MKKTDILIQRAQDKLGLVRFPSSQGLEIQNAAQANDKLL